MARRKKSKEEKKNDIRFLMKSILGLIDLSKLEETNLKDIYLTNGAELFEKYVFYNGFDYIPINPFLYEVYGVEMKDDIKIHQIQPTLPQMDVDISSDKFKDAVHQHKNRIKLMVEKGNWVLAFASIEKKIGLSVLIREFDNIPDDQKYDSFIEIYTRSEFGFEILKEHYKKIFSFSHLSEERNKRIEILREKFGSDEFKIFHGVSYNYPVFDYYSWTLNEITAEFFAYRYSSFGEVLEKEIDISLAIDYLVDKNEEEILFSPSEQFLRLMFKKEDE